MTRKNTKSQTAVERLLEQQHQYQEWLTKLDDEARRAAPSHVAERVRGDYAARLEEVNAELREHEDALRQALEDATGRSEGLAKQHAERTDELAEARLRHQVGEYDDERFEEVASGCKAALGELTKAIAAVDRDIERYEEILSQIAGDEEPEDSEEPEVEVVAPAPADPGARGAASPPQVDLDELAFLRSVTPGEKPGQENARAAPPRRVSLPGMPIPAAAAAAAAAPPPPPPPPPAPPAPPPPPPPPPDPVVASVPRREPSADLREAGEGGPEARTLVCSECGTKNLPTEWYCEKCGAELSAF